MRALDLVLLIIVNMIDFFLLYILVRALVNENLQILPLRKGIKLATSGLIYGILIGGIAYIVLLKNIDLYIFRIITTVTFIFLVKCISKKSFLNTLILYVIIFLIILFIQTPINILLTGLSLEGFYISIPGQILSLVCTIIIYYKTSISYFYGIVERNVLLKLIIYIAMSMASILLLSTNYIYSTASLFYFLILMVFTMTGLSLLLVRISFYTNQVSKNLHDTKNLLWGIHMSAHSTTDIDEIRNSLDECIELLELKNSVLSSFQIAQEKENILHFIEQKKEEKGSNLELVTDITYIDGHEKLPLSMVIYMLGTVLDNAIEYVVQNQIKNKPILVKLLVMDDIVEIHVSNPYEKEASIEFQKAFDKGHSTKLSHRQGTDGRGYGLFNLKSIVKKYGGIIYYASENHTEYNYTYLTISIEISCYSSYKAETLGNSIVYGEKTLYLVKLN